jgi:hypothetical protein
MEIIQLADSILFIILGTEIICDSLEALFRAVSLYFLTGLIYNLLYLGSRRQLFEYCAEVVY